MRDAAKDARAKPPPARTGAKPKSRVELAAHKAKRELELTGRKRDAEKRKAQYLQSAGGGLKYTALAMANRADRGQVV